MVIIADEELSPRAQTTFSRFTEIDDFDIKTVIQTIIMSLQGDAEASSGRPIHQDDFSDEDIAETDWVEEPGRGFETAKGSDGDLGKSWGSMKEYDLPSESR